MFKKGDLIILILVGVLGFASFFGMRLYRGGGDDGNKIAVIKQKNKVIERIELDHVEKPYEIKIEGNYEEIIKVEKGRIRFLEADCPDQICVKTGWLSHVGDTSVCLPNQMMIKIEGGKSEVDIVTY